MNRNTPPEGIATLIYRTGIVLALTGLFNYGFKISDRLAALEIYKAMNEKDISNMIRLLEDAKQERKELKLTIEKLNNDKVNK